MSIRSKNIYEKLLNTKISCQCGHIHEVPIKKVIIENQAILKLPALLDELKFQNNFHLVCDENTFQAAGEKIKVLLEKGQFHFNTTLFTEKFLVADEKAVNRLLSETGSNVECILAVGSGTINDLCRYAAFKLNKPYIIIATAPSMDGYASSVSPLIVGGFKRTITAVPPAAILCDLDVLCQAPSKMIAAGFGDILGKFTCLRDWKLSHLLCGEYYCSDVSDLVNQAVDVCVRNAELLASADEKAVEALMHALILSGIGMLMVGNSRPASGCEHHLSHFWEMRFLQENKEPALHGIKVGVATVLMADIYHKLRQYTQQDIQALLNTNPPLSSEQILQRIQSSFGNLAEEALKENLTTDTRSNDAGHLLSHWESITQILHEVPDAGYIRDMLEKAKAPVSPKSIGIHESLTREGILNCMFVRNRYTVLRLADRLGIL